jgi:hypothetical protein
VKIAKGKYPYGVPLFYAMDNILAYPAYQIEDKTFNPLSGMQFSEADR